MPLPNKYLRDSQEMPPKDIHVHMPVRKEQKRQFPGRRLWPIQQLNLSGLVSKWLPPLSMLCLSRTAVSLSQNYTSGRRHLAKVDQLVVRGENLLPC